MPSAAGDAPSEPSQDPPSTPTDIDVDEGCQARLTELLDASAILLDERAQRALREIDPNAAIAILADLQAKRDSIRRPSAYVGAAAGTHGAKAYDKTMKLMKKPAKAARKRS